MSLKDEMQTQPCKQLALFHDHLPKQWQELFKIMLANADACMASEVKNRKDVMFSLSQDLYNLYRDMYQNQAMDYSEQILDLIYGDHPVEFFLNTYIQDRAYGGPEEGGWWYNTWSISPDHPPLKFSSYQEALTEQVVRQPDLDKLNAERNSDINSVNSDGRYIFEVDIVPAYNHHDNEGYS